MEKWVPGKDVRTNLANADRARQPRLGSRLEERYGRLKDMISPSRMIARARHSDAAKQAHRLVRREGGTGRKSCLAPTEYERARAAAAERSRFLRAILEKGLNGVVGNHQILPGIRELPPQLSAEQRQLAEQRQETEQCQLVEERGVGYGVAAHLARFRWQMESPELLLMGRVCDAVHYFLMSRSAMTVRQQCSDNPGLLGRIYLEDLSYSDIPASLFPWLVVIETYFPDLFDSFFKQHRDWLAIGIAFDEPREFSAYGSCAAGGSEGEAGGQVRVSGLDLHVDKTSMVTCAHILPTNCQHLLHIWRDQDIRC